MGVTKSSLFTSEQNQLAQLAKAMAHPARVAILHYLLSSNSCVNGTLVQELGLAQATISQHLRELKDAGLIQGTIEGVSVSYCIHPENWEQLKSIFNQLFNQYTPACEEGDCC